MRDTGMNQARGNFVGNRVALMVGASLLGLALSGPAFAQVAATAGAAKASEADSANAAASADGGLAEITVTACMA